MGGAGEGVEVGARVAVGGWARGCGRGAGAEGWIPMDAAFPPEGEPTPVPSPTPRPWPSQIGDLASDGFVVYNLSAKVGAVGAPWGSRDASGQLCPDGGANMPCEGEVSYSSGMEADNIGYVKEMFARYAEGRTLAIYIRDDAPADVPLTYDGPYYQLYGRATGGAMELHLVFKGAFFGLTPQQKDGYRWFVDGRLWRFLATFKFLDAAKFEGYVLGNEQPGFDGGFPLPDPLARDLTALGMPAKIILKF